MPKEKAYNPVAAQRKADKQKAIKKNRATVASQRNERLAKRNPDRLQEQIDDLKAITSSGGTLTRHETQLLEGLEKEFKAVTRARQSLGDNAPTFSSRGGTRTHSTGSNWAGRSSVLGKRGRRDSDVSSSGDEEVPEEVRNIPMPRDTPPPIPKEALDKWYAKKRERYARRHGNANTTPLGDNVRLPGREGTGSQEPRQAAAAGEAKTVYEAKPVTRNLQREAAAFVPSVVRSKIDKVQGKGGLMEPEEADRLEQEGYLKAASTAPADDVQMRASRRVAMEEVQDDGR